MPLKSPQLDVNVHVDPLSLTAGIRVLAGNAVQTYDRDRQEYQPDRQLVPLVVLPEVSVYDPTGQMDGVQTLTGVEWYEGAPAADNRITDSADYEIADGTVDGFPRFALRVKKNTDAAKPVELFAIAIFTDTRRATEVRVERSIRLYSATYDAKNYSLKITDQPSTWTFDPLRATADADGRWMQAVTAQLYSGTEAVDDAEAAYWWEVFTGGAWRAITQDDLDIWLDGKDAAGNWTKTLRFDARMLDGETAFRARAAFYAGTRPESPTSEELQATTTVKMEMPRSLAADIRQTKGIKVKPDLGTTVAYECVLSDNRGLIGTDKDALFLIEWYGKSAKAGSAQVKLGEGRTVEFVPSEKGFDPGFTLTVQASVKLYAGHALVVQGDAAITLEGKYVVNATYS